jgi:predicted AlkP superfamily phosphohydrolase/phosphomutase
MSGPAKVACITLDAVEQSLLRTWAKQGLLPHLGKLFEESVSSETRNPEIIYSGTLWASFNTGVWPGRHDHYYYLQPDSGSYGLRLFMPEDVSVDSIWNTIAREGRRVALIDLPKSRLEHLPQTLHVSFWGEHEVLQPLTCWPPSLEQEVVQIAGKDPVGACDLVRQRPDELRRLRDGLLERAKRRGDLALAILDRGPWDLFVFNFSEAHCAGHQLWAARDPGHPEYKPALRSALGEDPLLDVYQAIDRSLGRIVDALGREAFLLVLATHGIGPRYDAAPALDAVLRRLDGIATPTISGPVEAVRKVWLQIPGIVRRPFRHIIDRLYDASRKAERAKRRFFVIPTTDNCGGIRINLKGREPEGQVEPGAPYRKLCDWLKEELLALKNVKTGAPVVTRVLHGDDLFPGAYRNEFPDLVIEWNADAPIPAVRSQSVGEIPVESLNPRTGDHRPKGFVMARSPGLQPHTLEGAIPLVDLVPTLAAHLGVQLSGIDGKPVPEFFPQGARPRAI